MQEPYLGMWRAVSFVAQFVQGFRRPVSLPSLLIWGQTIRTNSPPLSQRT